MGVMRATDQVTIVEGGIGDTTELETKVEELNNNLTNINNNQIKYKTLEFDVTVGSNAPIAIYNYSDDEDLKNAEIVGIVPTQINLFTTISLYNLNININTKVISIWVSTGQRVSGYYSVLYR